MASFFSGLANQAQGLIAEKMGKGEPAAEGAPAEGEVPVEGAENGEVPPEGGIGGFMGGMMAKANAVKAVAAEKAGGLSGGNLQSMAGGVMGQVQGLIPGMKREEEVPDPAPPAEGEYAEYTEEQYAEQGYTEEEQYAQ